MATLDTDIEIFINRAQQKIGTLGDTILVNDEQGICIDYNISLLQELSAAVDMFQNACCTPDENLSYKTIHYLTEKAGMSIVPIAIFDNNCLVDQVLLPSGGYIEGQKGDKGDAATIAIGTVTTLPAGDSATVTNSGNSSNAIFNFGIPAGAAGLAGSNGTNGWSPIYGIVVDGEREVLQLTGWTGGTGSEPGAVGQYLGTTGFVADIADAANIRGGQGNNGNDGSNGFNGWSPVIVIIEDGERRVLQVISWIGGDGTPPESGLYISGSGFTDDIALAIDIRGEQGIQGDPFTINASGLLSERNTYDDEGAGFTFLATDTGDVYIKNSILTGDWGPPISFVGQKGWSPVLNTVEDGERVVLRVSDWIGGEGTKPAAGGYVSNNGFASDISEGTDIRGLRGEFFIDVATFLSDRGNYDAEERPFTFYAIDNGKIYLKNSDALADWTTGFDWRGERGPDGEVGSQGVNAFTITTGTFTVPAISSTVNVSVQDTSWMSVGQILFIETAGYYIVDAILSSAVVTLENTGYTGNAAPTTLIGVSQKTSPGGIAGASVDTSTLWSITGNELAARGSFGSTVGFNKGFDFIKNGVALGGLSDTARWYLGVSAEFTDTSFSFKTLGNDNTTVGHWLKNSSDTTLFKVLDGGEFLIGRSDLVGGTQFNIKALGSTNSFYPVYIVNSSNTELFQILAGGSGKYVFGPTGGTVDMVNIGASAANTYIRINADSGYDSGFRLYENSVFKGGFLSDSLSSMAQFYGQNLTAAINIDVDNNIGIRGTSFGSGEGVVFIANATTVPSTDPTGGYVEYARTGTLNCRTSSGVNGLVTGDYQSKSATYTALVTDQVIECTANTFTVTLYTAVGNKGRVITINNQGAGVITVEGDGTETINGSLNQTLNQYVSLTIVSNGSNWIII